MTKYVAHVRVDGQPLYATYSFLGMSLTSLLSGAGGSWPQVQGAQAEYVRRPGTLATRQESQLRFLQRVGGLSVCRPAGQALGVLFTEPVPGEALGDLLWRAPARSGWLLQHTVAALGPLHRPRLAEQPDAAGVVGERGIATDFEHTFHGAADALRLDRLVAAHHPQPVRLEAAAGLRVAVGRLRQARLATLQSAHEVLLYGALAPGHILFPDSDRGRPVLLAPALCRGRASGDAAQLISRIVLRLIATRPTALDATRILDGIEAFAEQQLAQRSAKAARSWQCEVLSCWLMDTALVLRRVLLAPSGLPLPEPAQALAGQPLAACRLLEWASAVLLHQADIPVAWHGVLTAVREAVT
ncbi:hypothetical protein [Streptomyces sp. NPDC016845]|uniref:hypothetical protein n=1 Tax=Streptomyces sp. NPDC016845 TaxID=3364972 RepID=UPI00378DE6F9